MWKWLTVVAYVIATGAALAAKEKYDGNELIRECRFITEPTVQFTGGEEGYKIGYDVGWCRGLISGHFEEMIWRKNICVPSGVRHVQAWRVVKKFLDDNPALLHKRESKLIRTALVEAWPCK